MTQILTQEELGDKAISKNADFWLTKIKYTKVAAILDYAIDYIMEYITRYLLQVKTFRNLSSRQTLKGGRGREIPSTPSPLCHGVWGTILPVLLGLTAIDPYRLCLIISMQVSAREPLMADSKQPLPNTLLPVTLAPRSNNTRTMRELPKYAAISTAAVCWNKGETKLIRYLILCHYIKDLMSQSAP